MTDQHPFSLRPKSGEVRTAGDDDSLVVDEPRPPLEFEFDLTDPGVAELYFALFCPIACCVWCRAQFFIPVGTIPRTESTRDVPPPATVHVWAVPEDRPRPRLPEASDPVIHECHHGTPGPRWSDHVGADVIFRYHHGEEVRGVITSTNGAYVFVRFDGKTSSESCDPAMLRLADA